MAEKELKFEEAFFDICVRNDWSGAANIYGKMLREIDKMNKEIQALKEAMKPKS